jgi:thioredoxin 1
MVKEFTDANFDSEVLKAKGVVLVDVFAQWCGPCKAMSPTIDAISEEYKDKVKVGKLDVDKSPNAPGKYNILSVPTLLFFKDGQLIDQSIGLVSKPALQKKLDALVK